MKKWGGQLDIRPPNKKIGGGRVPPIPPPRIDAPAYISTHSLTQKKYKEKKCHLVQPTLQRQSSHWHWSKNPKWRMQLLQEEQVAMELML